MIEHDIVMAWNQRVGRTTAHLEFSEMLTQNNITEFYQKACGKIKVQGKKILDFGCGGGLLLQYLNSIEEKALSYTGIDIAPRSLEAAEKNNLKSEIGYTLYLIHPYDLEKLKNYSEKIDVFVSLNVIQHFPDMAYLEYFCKNINELKIKEVILHIRYSDETCFSKTPYKTTHDINIANVTNKETIAPLLTNYKLNVNLSEKDILIFRLKK